MSASPEVIHPQNVAQIAQCWKGMPIISKDSGKESPCTRLTNGDASSSGEDCNNTKVRKPYTITKQRERWTENEHQKFLEALKLYGRAWRRIEEYIGTKTAVQIRSHAQKFFSKLEREASTGSPAADIEIPPPRPKRKPSHPYPKKAGNSPLNLEDGNKEPSALSSPGLAAGHHREGFQSGSFTPYIGKGLGSGLAAFHRNPLVVGHFFAPQGSVKLFGKTVVIPKTHKPASQNDSTKERLCNREFPFPSTQTYSKADLQQSVGFSPFSKVGKDDKNLSEEPSHSDRDGSCSVINPSEGAGKLHALNCSDGLADSHILSEGEEGSRVGVRKIENTFSPPQKDCLIFPHGAKSFQHWMDSFLRYHTLPPLAGHGLLNGPPTNPLTYWQFMQASAVNYAAYAAAMAATAAAGWTGSIAGREESADTTQADVKLSLADDRKPAILPSAATPWWPFKGFMPLGYNTSPIVTMCNGEQVNAHHPLEHSKEDASLEHISSQGEYTMDLETEDAAVTSELFSQAGCEEGNENNIPAEIGCMLGTSYVTEEPVSESALPDSEIQHEVDATSTQLTFCTHASDTERTIALDAPWSPYSSSDGLEGQVKKQREGSSSGSNTPASRCHLSECESPNMSESKKRTSTTLFESNDDICCGAFKEYHQLCVMESPRVRAKHAEKGRKHQQKDSRHGGSDNFKRLKSCAHEIELRKEVSQEGRRAFRALFTSKLLPQTFAATNKVEEVYACLKNEHVSKPTMSKKETDSINAPMSVEEASGECINPDGSPQEQASGEIHSHGSFSRTTTANSEMGFGKHEDNCNNFMVSSSSGFVPYRRPLCTEPNPHQCRAG